MKLSMILFPCLLMAASLAEAAEIAARTLTTQLMAEIRSEAARSHPAASAAKHRALAAGQDVRAVRLWYDPMVGLNFMAAEKMMRQADGDITLGFDQPLPKPGLFSASRDKAEATRRAEVENAKSAALDAASMAAANAIELALADESISLESSQVTWLESMAENARHRVIHPGASSVEALRLDSELARERQILEAARRTRESLARKLNLSLGRGIDSPWPALKLPDNPPPVPVAAAEIKRIPRANPKVRAMLESANAAQAERRMTERERQPEVSVGVETNLYSGGDFRSSTFGIKMTLPWLNERSYSARTEAARLREKAATADIETTRREVADSVLSAAAEAANAAAQARAYAGEVYQKSVAATLALEDSWIASKSELAVLLESKRMLFSIKLEQRRFIAMQLAALEELNRLVP